LFEKGANPNYAIPDNPLTANSQRFAGLVGTTSLHMASEVGQLDVVRFLIHVCKVPVDVAITDQRSVGATPLFMASRKGHADVVRELAAAGANALVKSGKEQANALIISSLNGHASVVRMLVQEYGVPVDYARPDGFTPLHAAAQEGNVGIIKLLLELGANPKAQVAGLTASMITMQSLMSSGSRISEQKQNSLIEAVKLLSDAEEK